MLKNAKTNLSPSCCNEITSQPWPAHSLAALTIPVYVTLSNGTRMVSWHYWKG